MNPIVPDKLYKYKSFNVFTLRMLTQNVIYYADPTSFNDPLDCKPEIHVDVDNASLERLCHKLIEIDADIATADSSICRFREISYHNCTNDNERGNLYKLNLTGQIREQLYSIMKKKGVFALGENWNCPLMWSHYADEHKGICFEYDISNSVIEAPKRVEYDGMRCVLTSDLIDWLFYDSDASKNKVEHTYFATKAGQWKYEREWRFIEDAAGEISVPFLISAIYFGMRCDPAVITTIIKLMAGTDVKFYKAYPHNDSFELERRELDPDDMRSYEMRLPLRVIFANVPTLGGNSLPS
jgi:hypothetical protein